MITTIEFGPYDNGYILIGLETGQLLAYDFTGLELIFKL